MPAAPPILGSTGSTMLVLATILVVVGIAMVCLAVWLVRATRTDARSLGPLEVMGDRSFRRRDAAARLAALERARPQGAPPPAPMVDGDEPVVDEPVVEEPAIVEPAIVESVADVAVEERAAEEPAIVEPVLAVPPVDELATDAPSDDGPSPDEAVESEPQPGGTAVNAT